MIGRVVVSYRTSPAFLKSRASGELRRKFQRLDYQIELLTNVTVWGIFPPKQLAVARSDSWEMIEAEALILAPGVWAGTLAATIGLELPVFPVRSQVVLTETLPHTLNACQSTSACYMAQKDHGEVLIGSTTERAGFDVSVTEDAVSVLCQGAIRTIPMLRGVRVKRAWSEPCHTVVDDRR